MSSDYAIPNVSALAARWWVLVIRGAAAILFGILAVAVPRISLFALVMLWGAYALVDGVFNLMLAARGARAGRRWGWLLFEGILSIAAGVVAFAWPGITALVLLALIGFWAVLTGIAEIAAAIRLRRQIRGEWLLATSGILSIAFGVLVLLFPGAGALALVWMIGAYAIVFGGLLIGLGVRLKRWGRPRERPIPTGGMPTPA
jgi:uncharacterized membrane protein HdeD (DUF308 family)